MLPSVTVYSVIVEMGPLITGLIVWVIGDHRAQRRLLGELEAHGATRRDRIGGGVPCFRRRVIHDGSGCLRRRGHDHVSRLQHR